MGLAFICKPCKTGADIKAGDANPLGKKVKKTWHDQCVGTTWCDCQHRIGAKTV